jgi:hypothetical protein
MKSKCFVRRLTRGSHTGRKHGVVGMFRGAGKSAFQSRTVTYHSVGLLLVIRYLHPTLVDMT